MAQLFDFCYGMKVNIFLFYYFNITYLVFLNLSIYSQYLKYYCLNIYIYKIFCSVIIMCPFLKTIFLN